MVVYIAMTDDWKILLGVFGGIVVGMAVINTAMWLLNEDY